jgi:hypothetical protein
MQAVLLLNMILNTSLMTLWFITLIVLFYVMAPLFIYRYSILKAIVVTLCLYAALLFLHQRTGYVDLRLPQYLIPFALGIIAARLKPAVGGIYRWITIALCFACLVVFGYMHGKVNNEIIKTVFLDIVILSAVPIAMEIATRASAHIDGDKIAGFSYCTYAMYLSHRIIFGLGVKFYQPESFLASLVFLVLLLLPVTIALSYFFQKSYDSIVDRITV